MTIVEKIEAFLDEMTDLSKSDPERVMEIMRAFGGLLIMAELMKEETKMDMIMNDADLKEEIIAKAQAIFRDKDDLPN
tara:strand:- start:24 stop:257 length:234 start_codon:yes stop_codon:yes gene_type:complete